MEQRNLYFADSGLNQNPNPEELAAIAKSSADSFELLGVWCFLGFLGGWLGVGGGGCGGGGGGGLGGGGGVVGVGGGVRSWELE